MDYILQPDFAQRICNALFDETRFPIAIVDLNGMVIAVKTDGNQIQEEPLDCYTRPILHRGIPVGSLRFYADSEQVRPIIGIALRMIRMLMEKREQLRNIAEKNSEILDHIYDGYYEVDLKGNLVQFNKSLCEIFGYEHEDLRGINYRKLMDASSARRLTEQFILVYRSKKPRRSVEFEMVRRDGDIKVIDASVVLICQDGKPIGFRGIIRNVTERKRAERLLAESEQRYKSIVDYNPEVIFSVDLQGRFLTVNPAATSIFGYSAEDVIGQTFESFVAPEDLERVKRNFCKSREGVPQNYTLIALHQDGHRIELDLQSVPIFVEGQIVGVYGIAKDVTKEKQTEELLRKSEKLSVLGQLAAGVAHEIRNPLTAIKGFVQLLQSTLSTNPQYFEIILSELERINLIVSEFMMLAKPQASRFKQKSLPDLIQSIMALISSQAMIHNVQIVTDFGEEPCFVFCEENQLKQVFINIMKNAIEAMPNGGRLLVTILQQEEEGVVIRFQDNGCGIPADRIPKLGEPFYTTKEKGTGLGMMVSYKIIETHRGKISIASEVGVGTTIDVYLPTAQMLEFVLV